MKVGRDYYFQEVKGTEPFSLLLMKGMKSAVIKDVTGYKSYRMLKKNLGITYNHKKTGYLGLGSFIVEALTRVNPFNLNTLAGQ